MRYKKLSDRAIAPAFGSEHAAGLDLYACMEHFTEIRPGETVKIGTGIALEIPEGYFGAVFARSGMATNRGLRPANCVGVIDSDYRGEIIVALHNDSISTSTEIIKSGDRIAQLVVLPYATVSLEEAEDLSDTARGSGGFGSTGESELPGQTRLF